MPIRNTKTAAEKQADRELIDRIAERAQAYARTHGRAVTGTEIGLAIAALHNGGTPLRLEAFANAPDLAFWQEIAGILSHTNADGTIADDFAPRYAA